MPLLGGGVYSGLLPKSFSATLRACSAASNGGGVPICPSLIYFTLSSGLNIQKMGGTVNVSSTYAIGDRRQSRSALPRGKRESAAWGSILGNFARFKEISGTD
jgi:hypothetical protein